MAKLICCVGVADIYKIVRPSSIGIPAIFEAFLAVSVSMFPALRTFTREQSLA